MNKNLTIFKSGFLIKLKTIREYPLNFIFGFLTNITYVLILIFSYSILQSNFTNIFYWNYKEYIFFIFLLEIFLHLFISWFRNFRNVYLSGEINSYLTKPINTVLHYVINNFKIHEVLIGLLYFILFTLYVIFFIDNFYFIRFLITFLFSIIGGIFLIVINSTMEFIVFFTKSNKFTKKLYYNLYNSYTHYPINFFDSKIIKGIGLIIPMSFYAVIATDFYFNYINLKDLFFYFIILIILIFIFSIISILLWKYGMKKYEAYG